MEEQLKNKDMNETKYCYPTQETWFICWGKVISNILDTDKNSETYNEIISVETGVNEIKAYGSIDPTQCLTSPWESVDYYTDESVWVAILLENGINPFPEELINE
tara:strand:- start:148 stop:462 length:315 start_codon:yes stop_codon:yes gene_type:complete